MTSDKIKFLSRDLDAKRIKNYIAANRVNWALENFDKNLAELEKNLVKLKVSDYIFYE